MILYNYEGWLLQAGPVRIQKNEAKSMNVLFFITPKSEVAYLYDDYSLRQAMEKMEHYRYSSVPIIDRRGCYLGTITEGDLLWYLKDRGMVDLKGTEKITIRDVKRRWHNEPVNVNCEIEDLILTSMNQNFVPVIDDNKIFIGIIRRKDIIAYCYDHYKKNQNAEKQ